MSAAIDLRGDVEAEDLRRLGLKAEDAADVCLKKPPPAAAAEALKQVAPATPIEVWFQDEMRVGQKNGLVYQWAKKGTRPRQPKDQRYENAYLFGAVCPSRDTGVALIMPNANTEAMQKHLDEIGRAVTPGAHALIIPDKAAGHTTRPISRCFCMAS